MTNYNDEELETPTKLKMSMLLSWLFYAWAMFGVTALVLRVFLLATSANMTTGFTAFIARTSANYLQPFYGIFPAQAIGDTGYFDVSAVFAAIIYMFLAWGFKELITYIQRKIDQNRAEQQDQYLREAVRQSSPGQEKTERVVSARSVKK